MDCNTVPGKLQHQFLGIMRHLADLRLFKKGFQLLQCFLIIQTIQIAVRHILFPMQPVIMTGLPGNLHFPVQSNRNQLLLHQLRKKGAKFLRVTDVRIRIGFLHCFFLRSSLHFCQAQFFNDTVEPQFLQKILQFRRIWYRKGLIHHRTVNGHIQPDCGQILAEQGVLPVYGQVFLQLSLHLIGMIQNIFQSAVLLKQSGRRLGPDTGHSRNIIRFVPHQPFHINELKRRQTIFLLHFLLIVSM